MRRVLGLVATGLLIALGQPAHAAPPAATASASGGAVFTTSSASYVVRIDVERGFTTALPGEVDLVKQVSRCTPKGSDCHLVAQEAGPLQDGESFSIGTDHKARLKARWLGFPLVMTWDRYVNLPEQTGITASYGHGNWSQNFSNYSLRFVNGTYSMLGNPKSCERMVGVTIVGAVASSERVRFTTEPLPSPATLTDLRMTKGRCQR